MAPAVVAARADQEVALRGDGKKSYPGLSGVSELSLVCVLGQRTGMTSVRSQPGAQELHLC